MSYADKLSPEIADLLNALCEGELDPDDAARLEQMVCVDPVACRLYLRYLDLHVEMCRRFGHGPTPGNKLSRQCEIECDDEPCEGCFEEESLRGKRHETDNESLIMPPAINYSSVVSHPQSTGSPISPVGSAILYNSFNYLSSGWPAAYLIATVIFGIGALIGAFTYVSQPAQVARQSASLPSPLSPLPSVVGRITGLADCRWVNPSASPFTGDVALGHKFALASGLMEITYDTGAKVILQGPVTFEIQSKNGGFLSVGKLTGKVEAETARGFSVQTPSAVVTDLGTEFGVEVNRSGGSEVHVFHGEVDFAKKLERSPGDNTTERRDSQRLTAGQAARAELKAGTVSIARLHAARPEQYVRTMQAPRTCGVAVVNPSFEMPKTPEGKKVARPPSGWSGAGDVALMHLPTEDAARAADGQNLAVLGADRSASSMWQSARLRGGQLHPNTVYQLDFDVTCLVADKAGVEDTRIFRAFFVIGDSDSIDVTDFSFQVGEPFVRNLSDLPRGLANWQRGTITLDTGIFPELRLKQSLTLNIVFQVDGAENGLGAGPIAIDNLSPRIVGQVLRRGPAMTIYPVNDGFELPNIRSGHDPNGLDLDMPGTGWMYMPPFWSGICRIGGDFGMADATNGNHDGASSPSGQAAWITFDGTINQTLRLPGPGDVAVLFELSGRGSSVNPIRVSLVDSSGAEHELGVFTAPAQFMSKTTRRVAVPGGDVTLRFSGVNDVANSGSFIDNVRLEFVPAAGAVAEPGER